MERHAAQAPALRERYPYSTFDVERSMFDVQIVASEITANALQHRKCGQRGNPEGYKFEKLFLFAYSAI
jgi:hypothetical protein